MRPGLKGLAAAAAGSFAVFVEHPAAVLRTAIFVSPLATQFLVYGKALRVAKVSVTAKANVRGHGASPSG